MSGSLMQYTCCYWDVIDKTIISLWKSVICLERLSTILFLRELTRDYFFFFLELSHQLIFWGSF